MHEVAAPKHDRKQDPVERKAGNCYCNKKPRADTHKVEISLRLPSVKLNQR
jgi:hypothetical protein